MKRSGVNRNQSRVIPTIAAQLALAVLLLSTFGCYGFNSGGGFPPKLKSFAIVPFDNQTAVPDVQRELNDYLRKQFQDRLNLREVPEAKADVVVHGVIGKYEVDLPAGVSADPRAVNSSRRRLLLVIDVEIADQTTGRTLVKRAGVQSEGQYAEGQEASGRKIAIETIVDEVIRNTQSQW
ncbi:MAG: LPS assembly lipoprotein LptE [Gemmatimonadaceae bacterium]